ncbi:MAG: hypothetical protein J6O49_11045 [Bacteroidaceae bacterium]|nr:hypothetical protein [Bacteroidaceae bacterium]
MRKVDITKIPEKIVLEKELNQAVGELSQAVRQIQDAVCTLKEIQDITFPTSADPNAWSEALKDADKRKDEALKAIEADVALPTNSKQKLAQDWKEWHKSVAVNMNIIIRLVTKNQDCKFQWKNNTIEPTAPILEVAETEAVRDVPSEARDHARLLALVYDAIDGLREWEHAKGVRKVRLEQLLSLDETKLAEAWTNGTLYHPSCQPFDTSFERSMKSVQSYIEGTFV